MVSIKHPERLIPFNEYFHRSCLFNVMIPVLQYYDVNQSFLWAHTYHFNVIKNGLLQKKYVSSLPFAALLNEAGIEIVNGDATEKLSIAVSQLLTEGLPVIMWVDSYYMQLKQDAYQRIHWPHCLLIYGIESEKGLIHCIENTSVESMAYSKRIIMLQELEQAHEGYLMHFSDTPFYDQMASLFGIRKNPENITQVNNDVWTQYHSNVCAQKSIIKGGINKWSLFAENIIQLCNNKDEFWELYDDIAYNANDLLNASKADLYHFKSLHGSDHSLCNEQSMLLNTYKKYRNIIFKKKYTNKINADNIANVIYGTQISEREINILNIIESMNNYD